MDFVAVVDQVIALLRQRGAPSPPTGINLTIQDACKSRKPICRRQRMPQETTQRVLRPQQGLGS